MNAHKVANIFALPSQERYGYFIRKVADFETVWLIRVGEDILLLGGDTEANSVPVWPEKAFAELLRTKEWEAGRVESMPIANFLAWLDDLQAAGISIAAFPKQNLQSVVVEAQQMKAHLLYELEQYE